MSVDRSSLTTIKKSYERATDYGKNAVASIKAELAYEKQQEIRHCPTSLDKDNSDTLVCIYDPKCKNYKKDVSSENLKIINTAHCCVIGKKTKSVAKFFAKNAEVEIYPPET